MPWSRSSPGDRPSAGDANRRSSRSVGRDARPSGSRWHVCTAACSPAPSSLPIYGSIAGRLFGSSGPCRMRRLAADETLEGRKVCRICGRGIYRALGAEDIRHRRIASDEVLLRRLLSLDYVLEHTDLPWLPTEPEKVGAFEALGIERRILPSRLYRGARREHAALLPGQAAGRAGSRARRVRLRRSRTRYHDGATLLGRGTSRPLGSAAGSAAGPSRSWPSSAP